VRFHVYRDKSIPIHRVFEDLKTHEIATPKFLAAGVLDLLDRRRGLVAGWCCRLSADAPPFILRDSMRSRPQRIPVSSYEHCDGGEWMMALLSASSSKTLALAR